MSPWIIVDKSPSHEVLAVFDMIVQFVELTNLKMKHYVLTEGKGGITETNNLHIFNK